MDRFLQMVVNTVMRRVMNLMVNRGVDHFAGKGKAPSEMSKEERAQAKSARQAIRRTRQIARMARRIK
jgi:hypothetical protein